MSELNEHLDRVQDIAIRARNFQADESLDLEAFSESVVDDLGVLVEALSELIKRAKI